MEGCWINPEGKIFEVRSCRHLEFATNNLINKYEGTYCINKKIKIENCKNVLSYIN